METPYRAVSFSKNDPITRERLDQMQSNLRWIQENTPTLRVVWDDRNHEVDTVMVCGRQWYERQQAGFATSRPIVFGDFFHPVEQPRVLTGICTTNPNTPFAVANGLGPNDMFPTAVGFDLEVAVVGFNDPRVWAAPAGFWVYWQAIGWGLPRT